MVKDAKMKKDGDVAKNTILVLLILTLLLSAISTWVVLDALSNVKSGYLYSLKNKPGTDSGNIQLGIMPNPNVVLPQMTEKGNVRLGVVQP